MINPGLLMSAMWSRSNHLRISADGIEQIQPRARVGVLTDPVSKIERIKTVIQLHLYVNSTVRELGEYHSWLPFRSVLYETPHGPVESGWARIINLKAPQICKQGTEIFKVP